MGAATREPRSTRPDHPVYRRERERHGFFLRGEFRFRTGEAIIGPHEGNTCSFPTEIMYNARNVTGQPCQPAWSARRLTIPKDVADSLADAAPARKLAEQN